MDDALTEGVSPSAQGVKGVKVVGARHAVPTPSYGHASGLQQPTTRLCGIGDEVVTMPRHPLALHQLRLLGGWLCLDFVNSIENRAGHTPEDFVTSYPDLVRWGRHAGVVSAEGAARLIALAARDEPGAREALADARALRDALHRVFLALARTREPDRADLERVQRAYTSALSRATLIRGEEHFDWDWPPDALDFARMLWPVADSAIALLTTGDPRRIKVCDNPYGCGWLFYDSSKNGSRRWCSMEGCGSQVKMRRQYARRKAEVGSRRSDVRWTNT